MERLLLRLRDGLCRFCFTADKNVRLGSLPILLEICDVVRLLAASVVHSVLLVKGVLVIALINAPLFGISDEAVPESEG
jgi:hypothetical protein